MMKTNNPWNIRYNVANGWHGQIGQHNGFVVFDSVTNGIRAAIKLMHTYYKLRNCRTIWDIIHRYAPTTENDTLAYIDYVTERFARRYGESVSPDLLLGRTWASSLPRICWLLKFMADYETPNNGIQFDTIFRLARQLQLK